LPKVNVVAAFVGNPEQRPQIRATVQVATAIGDPNILRRTTIASSAA